MAKTTKAKGKAARRGPASAKGKGKGKGKPGGGRGGKKLAPRRDKAPRRSAPPVRRATAPARRAAPAPTTHAAPDVAKAALDKKGEDVLVLDVRGLTSYADYFVVVTADSDRQASAIADHVEQAMKENGVSKVGVEGYESGRWILVDYGDVVAHVMNRESRGFYDLEGLWADAPRLQVEG